MSTPFFCWKTMRWKSFSSSSICMCFHFQSFFTVMISKTSRMLKNSKSKINYSLKLFTIPLIFLSWLDRVDSNSNNWIWTCFWAHNPPPLPSLSPLMHLTMMTLQKDWKNLRSIINISLHLQITYAHQRSGMTGKVRDLSDLLSQFLI